MRTSENAAISSSVQHSKTTRFFEAMNLSGSKTKDTNDDTKNSREPADNVSKGELERFIEAQRKLKEKFERSPPQRYSVVDDQGIQSDKIKNMFIQKKRSMGLLVQGKAEKFDKNMDIFRKLDTFFDVRRNLQNINLPEKFVSHDSIKPNQTHDTDDNQVIAQRMDPRTAILRNNKPLYKKLRANRSSLNVINTNGDRKAGGLYIKVHDNTPAGAELSVFQLDAAKKVATDPMEDVQADKFERTRRQRLLSRKQKMGLLTNAEKRELETPKREETPRVERALPQIHFHEILAHLQETTPKLPVSVGGQNENNPFRFYTEVGEVLKKDAVQKPSELPQNEKVEIDEKTMASIKRTLTKEPNLEKKVIEEQDQLITRLETYKEKSDRILRLVSGATKHIYNKKFIIPPQKPRKREDEEEHQSPKLRKQNTIDFKILNNKPAEISEVSVDIVANEKSQKNLKSVLSPTHSVGARRISTECEYSQDESMQQMIQHTEGSTEVPGSTRRKKIQFFNLVQVQSDEKRLKCRGGSLPKVRPGNSPLARDTDHSFKTGSKRGLFNKFNSVLNQTDNLKEEFKEGLRDVKDRFDDMESYYRTQHRNLLIKSKLMPESLMIAAPKPSKGLLEKRREFKNDLTKKMLNSLY